MVLQIFSSVFTISAKDDKAMANDTFASLFTKDTLARLFPPTRADQFFDALFGDANEGAYDIKLAYQGHDQGTDQLRFELTLVERPGRCLACNLTYGLPEVFSRHPIINIKGLVTEVDTLLGAAATCTTWKLGTTQTTSKSIHTIPLTIHLQRC
jgi:hypothetical protein